MSEFNLKTGDILLCDYEGTNWFFYYFSKLIKFFTHSKYSHISMILKDPVFIHPNLKGYYVWQSSWTGKLDPQDDEIKLGVQITPFDEVYKFYQSNNSHISVRRINAPKNTFNNELLENIHEVVYKRPYDIIPSDWLHALIHKDTNPQKTDRFWCSSLVGYIYTRCHILSKDTDWSLLRPSDFSNQSTLDFINNCFLSKEENIL
mgnify:CR=1 FL=1